MTDHIWDRGYPDKIPEEVVVKISGTLPGYIRRTVYKKIQMSIDRNSRVLLQENSDTRAALDIAQQMEMAAKRLLDRVSRDSKTVVPLLVGWRDALLKLSDIAKETCEIANMEYRKPRGLMTEEELTEAKEEDKERRKTFKAKIKKQKTDQEVL